MQYLLILETIAKTFFLSLVIGWRFVTKSDKIKIFKKLQMNLFLASIKIWREKYLKESLFLKNFDTFWIKLAR